MLTIQEENGEPVVELPPEILQQLGWKNGDVLDVALENGSIVLRKQCITHENIDLSS